MLDLLPLAANSSTKVRRRRPRGGPCPAATFLALAITLAAAYPARAQLMDPWQGHAGLAGSGIWGGLADGAQVGTYGLGLFAGRFWLPQTSERGLMVAAGARANLVELTLSNKDRIDVDRALSWSLGPEIRVGAAWGHPGKLTELYAAATASFASAPARITWADEGGGTYSLRLVAGVTLVDSWWIFVATDKASQQAALALVPNTLEFGYEAVGHSHRGAIFIGYGF